MIEPDHSIQLWVWNFIKFFSVVAPHGLHEPWRSYCLDTFGYAPAYAMDGAEFYMVFANDTDCLAFRLRFL